MSLDSQGDVTCHLPQPNIYHPRILITYIQPSHPTSQLSVPVAIEQSTNGIRYRLVANDMA